MKSTPTSSSSKVHPTAVGSTATKGAQTAKPVATSAAATLHRSSSSSTVSSSTVSKSGEVKKKAEKGVSYLVYDKLVGESDGGTQLPREEVEGLLQQYRASWDDRMYVHWTAQQGAGKECVRVKGTCTCFCGHNFKSHAWFDDHLHCRCPGCKCTGFEYLPKQGSWSMVCRCKHGSVEHEGKRDGRCTAANCKCTAFSSSYVCMCGGPAAEHKTVVEHASTRKAAGKPVDTDVMNNRMKALRRENSSAAKGSIKKCSCLGCKCLMPCRAGKNYNKNETMFTPDQNPYVQRKKKSLPPAAKE